MSRGKYSELRRIDHSLNNYKLSIQENIKLLGFDKDLNDGWEVFQFLEERISKATLSKKPKIKKEDIEKLPHLFENMWINEAYVQSSLENLLSSKSIDHHYFYLTYISFYYSLFTSISIVLRLFEPGIKKESHSKKINNFNNKIISNRFLKECYFKPFTLVISNNEIKNLCDAFPNIVNKRTIRDYDKIISKYKSYCNNCSFENNFTINEDIHTLKVAKSLIKYYINENYKTNGISYIHYFMSKRHFLHYNASFIYDKSNSYYLDNLLDNIKNNMIYILNISNFLTESIFIRLSAQKELSDIYNNFDSCLIECIGSSLHEDDYIHQFENLIVRTTFHGIL